MSTNEILDFFRGLFATNPWPPRWQCGQWSDFHGWLYITSDLMIWFSYFAIPVIIVGYIYKKKYELKYTKTYVLFASFILLCGSTHLLDASMFWVPMYRFSGLILLLTGVVSLFTVYHLVRILPDAFQQKTSVVLEKEIAKRIEAERRLSEANKGLEAFAYMASHDLQEPLRKVKMFTFRLYEESRDKLDANSIQWAEKSISAADRMQRMIVDILSLSSLQEHVKLEPTDLQQVMKDVETDLEVKIQERSALIKAYDLPVVTGYHEYLVLLFLNLLSNAIKFSERQPVIRIYAEQTEESVIIYVKDNGIGMRQDETSDIFNPFHRLNRKEIYEGSGVGLAICKKIVDIHKGNITAQSAPGEGTTFKIELPREKSDIQRKDR